MRYSDNIRETQLINHVAKDFFNKFDCTEIIKDIDFAVKSLSLTLPDEERVDSLSLEESEGTYLLWAEAKVAPTNTLVMLTQLVLTIGKARSFDKILPPPFLGCFDCKKIAFIPYAKIQDVFYQSDFNWKIMPSDHETREFRQVYAQIEKIIDTDSPWEVCLFDFDKDEKELKRFIHENFVAGKSEVSKIKIDKNNFIIIYNKWLETVKPTVQINNWDIAKKLGIIDADFYLADLLSQENKTLKDKLSVILKSDHYELDRKINQIGMLEIMQTGFSDNQKSHTQFWAKYERPPLEEYWGYIIERRDLLVPQDVRERKGSFFTPKIWVELSQKYIADVLGEDWQDEYYVWDCAAGIGNLLAGLTNKYNIWASTLDRADVDVMKDRIRNGANLLEDHVFQFDFLNDNFTKLPQGLQNIINDETKRKKLVIYINPPYAEADNRKGEGRAGVAISAIHTKYSSIMGYTKREIYIQFLTRIYCEIPACVLADFSKLKNLQAPKFQNFRLFFQAKLEKIFLVPANTFDNVSGSFPIGFKIWNTNTKVKFEYISADVYDKDGKFKEVKSLWAYNNVKLINDWVKTFRNSKSESIATIIGVGSDFQNQRLVRFGEPNMKVPADNHHWQITKDNLIESCIYFTVRKIIPADWLNDRDQFLYPNDGWKTDEEFQNDCLTYTLFNNNIQSRYGVNHWIPFSEYAVSARDKFDSNFMTDFIDGKTRYDNIVAEPHLFYHSKGNDGGVGGTVSQKKTKREFTETAKTVFTAGRELWGHYHVQPKSNVNASLYDIREYFQGRDDKGKMNNKSDDETYNKLIANLRSVLKTLAKKIEPKLYEYGFLRE